MMRRIVSRSTLLSVASSVSRHVEYGKVVDLVKQRSAFAPDAVTEYARQFQKLGFDESYDRGKFSESEVAEHVVGYISCRVAVAEGAPYMYAAEKELSSIYLSRGTPEALVGVVRAVETFCNNRKQLRATHGVSVKMFRSADGETVLTTAALSPFFGPVPAGCTDSTEASIDVISTPLFKQSRSPEALQRSERLLTRMVSGHTTAYTVFTSPRGDVGLSIAFYADRTTLLGPLLSLMNEIAGASVVKCFMDTFANGVHIYTVYVKGASPAQVEEQASLVTHLPNRPFNAITQLFSEGVLTSLEIIFAHALITFGYYFTPKDKSDNFMAVSRYLEKERGTFERFNVMHAALQQEVMSERHLGLAIAKAVPIVKRIYADFIAGSTKERRDAIVAAIVADFGQDAHTLSALLTFVRFNEAVVKHNFNKATKAAIAFRLDPAVTLRDSNYTEMPFGIFLLVGPRWRGFHVRFTEIARGGVRMILSKPQKYKENKSQLFSENYRLAFAQMLKNKDIPEGGSKGTILVNTVLGMPSVKARERMYLQYVDSLLDVMLENQPGVVDRLGLREILFLGPDENTSGDLPTLGALLSKQRGYAMWKSLTTGKGPVIGGIPHEVYGMTTLGVRRCVDMVYKSMTLDGTKLSKFMTGGPKGDLGGNEILLGVESFRAISDGEGVAYDPNGLNAKELRRLVAAHLDIDNFNPALLSEGGFVVKANNQPVTLPDGTHFESAAVLRDDFVFTRYAGADIFIPCGGRPSTITISNVHNFVLGRPMITGEQMLRGEVKDIQPHELKYRIIVEGANLFLTDDARIALENVGVQLVKDSSANKGGVTSSSVEVFVGLALSDAEFEEHMSVTLERKPAFYQRIVGEIQEIIQRNAQREVELIFKEQAARPKVPKCTISDELSRKINNIRGFIMRSDLLSDAALVRFVIDKYAPVALKELISVDVILQRVPQEYIRSIVAVWLASNYVYSSGVHANELDFYRFMQRQRSSA